jgi:hypothetical protein
VAHRPWAVIIVCALVSMLCGAVRLRPPPHAACSLSSHIAILMRLIRLTPVHFEIPPVLYSDASIFVVTPAMSWWNCTCRVPYLLT